jgi:plasmid stabilization system protein ParE
MKIILTEAYERALEQIEDFIFTGSHDVELVERFLHDHDVALQFLLDNPGTPAVHPVTGDQSWMFGEGRYRVFFRVVLNGPSSAIYMVHIIDNRAANLAVNPGNSLPTYEIDE